MVVLVLALLVLVPGWLLGFTQVTSLFLSAGQLPDGSPPAVMVPSTALLFAVNSLALIVHGFWRAPSSADLLLRWVALGSALVSLLNIVLRVSALAPGIDAWVSGRPDVFTAQRMAIGTSLGFLLLAVVSYALATGRSRRVWVIRAATAGFLLALSEVLAYVTDSRMLQALPVFDALSLPTAIGFLLLFTALLARLPGSGWITLLLQSGPTARRARRLVLLVAASAMGLLLVERALSSRGSFAQHAGEIYLLLGVIISLLVFVVREVTLTIRLEQAELDRLRAVVSQRMQVLATEEQAAGLRAIVDAIPVALCQVSPSGEIVWTNAGFRRHAGRLLAAGESEATPALSRAVQQGLRAALGQGGQHLGNGSSWEMMLAPVAPAGPPLRALVVVIRDPAGEIIDYVVLLPEDGLLAG